MMLKKERLKGRQKEKMVDECHLCLLGLIALSSLLTGSSGVNHTHVFISSGEHVRLPCNNALHDCTSTTWNYNGFRHSAAIELIAGGKKKKNAERHERLSLGSDCSLNIRNISTEDCGLYTCRQYVNGQQGTDARVDLHVLHVSHTEISACLSVTLFCQLYSYPRGSCDDWIHSKRIDLFWVNQAGVKRTRSDSRYQISSSSDHCIVTLNTTLLNEDDNREWRCEVTQRDQVKSSVTYTVKSSAPVGIKSQIPVSSSNSETMSRQTPAAAPIQGMVSDAAETEVRRIVHSLFRVIVIIVEFAAFAAPTVILLQFICARRAGRKKSQYEKK
uniref:Ig-like domain-containing protein n=1 Tax=Cyprinus carpio TaxID=7962 RepID=A0A8C2CNU4_CYPCA